MINSCEHNPGSMGVCSACSRAGDESDSRELFARQSKFAEKRRTVLALLREMDERRVADELESAWRGRLWQAKMTPVKERNPQ